MPIVYSQPLGELQLKNNNLIGTLTTLYKEWEISFELRPDNYDQTNKSSNYNYYVYQQTNFRNILHLTTGGDETVVGDRIPAIFYHPKFGLHVATGLGSNPNVHADIMPAPPVDQWTTIVVSQLKSGSRTTFSVKIDGTVAYSSDNLGPQEFSNVKVYASDPWWKTQPGLIRDLTIKSQ